MSDTQQTGLTVDDGVAALLVLQEAGRGASRLMVAYDAGRASLGARTATPVTAFDGGFDWDSGRVFAGTQQKLGVAGPELKQLGRNLDDAAMVIYRVRRLLDDTTKSSDEKLAAIAAALPERR